MAEFFKTIISSDLQWILQATKSFGQIIHTSYAEILYANLR